MQLKMPTFLSVHHGLLSLCLTVIMGVAINSEASLRCESNFIKQTFFESYRESVAIQSRLSLRALDEAIALNSSKFNNWDTPTMLRLFDIIHMEHSPGFSLQRFALLNRIVRNVQPTKQITPDLLREVALAQSRLKISNDQLLNFLIVTENKLSQLSTESHIAKSIMVLMFFRHQQIELKNGTEIVERVIKASDQTLEDSLTQIGYDRLNTSQGI